MTVITALLSAVQVTASLSPQSGMDNAHQIRSQLTLNPDKIKGLTICIHLKIKILSCTTEIRDIVDYK